MEPITTAAIVLLARQLAEKGLEKVFETTGEEVSKTAIDWLKGLFKKNEKVVPELIELQEKPESPARLNAVKAIIERDLEDNPDSETYLKEIYQKVFNSTANFKNSKNINTGTLNSGGGNIHLGDSYGNK